MTNSIHARIKAKRLELKMSQADLAKLAGCSSWQSVQQWERGDTAPKRARLDAVAAALLVTPQWLLFGDT